MVKSQSVHDLE